MLLSQNVVRTAKSWKFQLKLTNPSQNIRSQMQK